MSLEAWGDEGLDGPDGYVTDERAQEMINEATEELRAGLKESLKLQSHYAELLNAYDGGNRMMFATVDAWLERFHLTTTK